MDISDHLIKFNHSDLPENFVSLATKIENGQPTHAAILIRFENSHYLHHFPGNTPPEVVTDFNEENWYVYKIFDVINPEDQNEVGAFLQHCRRVCSRSDITYSYIVDGSSYNNLGDFISRNGLPELGTCVGFCISTLTNSIVDADLYFHVNDWDDLDLDVKVDLWSINRVRQKYPNIDWTLYDSFKKRITPLEYLCSAFLSDYPIHKEAVARIEAEVISAIASKYSN